LSIIVGKIQWHDGAPDVISVVALNLGTPSILFGTQIVSISAA
jgi:hypothetical protein